MLRLLREHEVAAAFRAAHKKATKAVVAVPFWGKGGVSALGLVKGRPVRIVCNLDHPGCNPDAIDEIRELGIKVRTHPRLNAKIYGTERVAIVGSSNVSTNGLTVEGAASKGWLEANVCSDDPALVADVLALFESIWDDPDSKRVRKADIEAARKVRQNWPVPIAPSGKKTLLAACRENPDDFRSVYIAVYGTQLGKNGKRVLQSLRKGALAPKSGLSASDFRKAWGYQFDRIPEDAWLLDLNCIRPDKPRYVGTARATGLRLKADNETDVTIALPGAIRASRTGARLTLSGTERDSLVKSARRILSRGNLVPLPEAIKIIDGRK